MGMTYTFKDANGNMIFSVEGVNSVTDNTVSLESMANNICKKNNELRNSLNKIDFLSNTRTMESIGFISTESVGDSIKAIALKIAAKAKEFFDRVVVFFRKLSDKIRKGLDKMAAKRAANVVLKKLQNPTDADKAGEIGKVLSVINSDKMGEYTSVLKEQAFIEKTIDKLGNYTTTLSNDDEIDNIYHKLDTIRESASKVSAGEKRRAAVNFYKQVAGNGFEQFNSKLNEQISKAQNMATFIEKESSNVTDEAQARSMNKWLRLATTAYGLLMTQQSIALQLLNASNDASIVEAAKKRKSETDGQYEYNDAALPAPKAM